MECQELITQKKMERMMTRLNDLEKRLLIQKRIIEDQQREVKVLMEAEKLLSLVLEWYKIQLEWYGKERNYRELLEEHP